MIKIDKTMHLQSLNPIKDYNNEMQEFIVSYSNDNEVNMSNMISKLKHKMKFIDIVKFDPTRYHFHIYFKSYYIDLSKKVDMLNKNVKTILQQEIYRSLK